MSRLSPVARQKRPRFPTSKSELIAWVDELCPEPVVRPGMTPDEIMFLAGRRSVLRDLQEAYEQSFARPGDAPE